MSVQDKINAVKNLVIEQAEKCGGKRTESRDQPKDFVFRDNTSDVALSQGGAYFGFILGDEEFSGPYHDMSLVFFPPDNPEDAWLMSVGIGTLGFKNDYELAMLPGVKRRFVSILSQNGYAKTEMIDIESQLPKAFRDKLAHLKDTLRTYGKLLPICEIIEDPLSNEGKNIVNGFVAAYAELRNWATNNSHRDTIQKSIAKINNVKEIDEEIEVWELLQQRKFIVLQGAPGTGKTFLANHLSSKHFDKTFFTQFHAETTYTDFIYGIYPSVKNTDVVYEEKNGIFLESLLYAIQHPDKKVILIIDEINRANLSNVLGPIFYLFEYGESNRKHEITIGNGETRISKIPENFYVLATMNTADRSLAVIDFALRRRFAWYTLLAKPIKVNDKSTGVMFFEDEFNEMHAIFQRYASNAELVFEPGHSYFLARSEEEMNNRIRYEILPLIKEYIAEGIMINAQDEFLYYFQHFLGESAYQLWI